MPGFGIASKKNGCSTQDRLGGLFLNNMLAKFFVSDELVVMKVQSGDVLMGGKKYTLAEFDRKFIGMKLGDPGDEFPFAMRSGRIVFAATNGSARSGNDRRRTGDKRLLRKMG